MEKALALSPADLAGVPAAALKGAGVLYLGDEFCQNLLPSPAEFGRAVKAFPGRVALVTPLLSDEALDDVERVIRKFSSGRRKLEVVINDLGLLHTVRKKYAARVEVSIGRVLGHRVKVMPVPFAARFLAEHGARRVELDDASLPARFAPLRLKVSFHTSRRYISVTRFCPWEKHWPGPCGRACAGLTRKLEHQALPQPLLLKGACYCVKGGAAPAHPSIDRVVKDWAPAGGGK